MSETASETVLRDFLSAFNQWQRDAYLRWRLDNYDFTGDAIRAAARERTADELQADFAQITADYCSPQSGLDKPPETIAHPPVFDGFQDRAVKLIDRGDTYLFEVENAMGFPYRFSMVNMHGRWLIGALSCEPASPGEPWQMIDFASIV
jgi:hypothetical protein